MEDLILNKRGNYMRFRDLRIKFEI